MVAIHWPPLLPIQGGLLTISRPYPGGCMKYVVVIAALLMVLTTGQDLSLAQKRDSDARESLKGLPGVTVLIEGIKEDAQADGLSTEAVRTAVELALRSSGIRILTASEG